MLAEPTVLRARSTGPGMPMPAQMTAARGTIASASTSSIIGAEASRASAARWSTSSSVRRSASTLWARSATATCTWLCPKSIPTTALVESWSTSCTPGRPPRWPDVLPSTSNTRPEPLSSATRVETVVRDRPVDRAMSAWLARPLLLVWFVVMACGGGGGTPAKGKIAVLLPDSQSSSRWENDDRKFFEAAFKAAGLGTSDYSIVNAGGSASTQQTQADAAITNGATVILLVNLDSGSGATIEANAASKGVKTIDYDRLTLNRKADYYVSFDNVSLGKLQGAGLVKCLTTMNATKPTVAELNGSPTDNNATLFKQGYDSVLQPLYDNRTYVKLPDHPVPAWDNHQALTIFYHMSASHPKIDGVLAANDGLGNAVISALKTRHLNGHIPVTGQDATLRASRTSSPATSA